MNFSPSTRLDVHFLVLVMALIPSMLGCTDSGGSAQKPSGNVPELIGTSSHEATEIHGHLGAKIRPSTNCLYTCALQLMWNECQDSVVKEEIELSEQSDIARFLNRQTFRRSDISEDAFVVCAGTDHQDVTAEFERQMGQKFPGADIYRLPLAGDKALYSYLYLKKRLKFRYPFRRFDKPFELPERGETILVECFGTGYDPADRNSGARSSQVTILDYVSDDDFVVVLNSEAENDLIVLAKIQPEITLGETMEKVRRRIRNSSLSEKEQSMDTGEFLSVPIVDVNAQTFYPALSGSVIENAEWQGYEIGNVAHSVEFRLDETGVHLETLGGFFAVEDPKEPRQFIINRPFLIYLREITGEHPYFAMWVANTEVLEQVMLETMSPKEENSPKQESEDLRNEP